MKKPEREYPDIEFLETDTETIESNMIALYEEFVKQSGRRDYKVYPASRSVFLLHGAQLLLYNKGF